MGDVRKPDDLVRRVNELERALESLTAVMWRRERLEVDTAGVFVTSLTYDDSGAPFTMSSVVPGPTNRIIVGLSALVGNTFLMPPPGGVQCSVSFAGPTPLAADDSRSIRLYSADAGIGATIAGYFVTPVLQPGAYTLSWESKQLEPGVTGSVSQRAIFAIAF